MRVLFASDAAGFGGAEILAAHLASALRRKGWETGWASARPDERLRAHLDGVELVEAPLRHKSRYLLRSVGAFLDRPRVARVRAALAAWRPDVVVVNQPDPEDGVAIGAAARGLCRSLALLHLPQRLSVLGVRRLRAARSAVARRALHRYDEVVAVSGPSAAEAEANWGVRATACANGVPLPAPFAPGEREAARRALGLPGGARVVGALGRLDPQKGFGTLIDACAGLPEGIHVLIGGEGPERAALEARIAARGLRARAHLPGWIESRRLLAASDLLAMPSRFEGLPLALLEAGALGIDVVGTPVGGIPALLEPSAVVPCGDAVALAAAIRASLDGDGARARRLEARVRAEHSIEAMADRFAAILHGGAP